MADKAVPEDTKTRFQNRYELRNRYLFKGHLVMETALHIGGGKATLSNSDSPVVLTPEEVPFIPGSSFKGALRSTVEKLVPSLPSAAGLSACGLPTKEEEQAPCPTARQRLLHEALRRQEQNRSRRLQGQIRESQQTDNGQEATEQEISLEKEREKLCNACKLFGSPFAAGHINVNDLYISNNAWSGSIERRDGVAIDRDSEKARDGLKYDFEVVPAQAVFDLTITLENATEQDLQLLCVGLSEFMHGFGAIGGKRSRGLGACRLEDLTVFSLDLTDPKIPESERNKRLRDFLLERELERKFHRKESGLDFLERHIKSIFGEQ